MHQARTEIDCVQVSFAVKTAALEGATGGSRGKGKKRTRSGAAAAAADDAGEGDQGLLMQLCPLLLL